MISVPMPPTIISPRRLGLRSKPLPLLFPDPAGGVGEVLVEHDEADSEDRKEGCEDDGGAPQLRHCPVLATGRPAGSHKRSRSAIGHRN